MLTKFQVTDRGIRIKRFIGGSVLIPWEDIKRIEKGILRVPERYSSWDGLGVRAEMHRYLYLTTRIF
jgi:hypothetical protein